MLIQVLKSKITHAAITEANLHYEGSITIPEDLMDAVDFIAGEKVQVLNINNGQRFETYILKGVSGSTEICLNGPAARLGVIGDRIMIISYALMSPEDARQFSPKILHLDEFNKIKN